MKKALVLSLALVLCLGAATFGQITGYWSSSISIDPQPLSIVSMSSTLKVGYALSGWTFTSLSTFDLTGWASQKFSVAGALGAFALKTNLTFAPAVVSVKQYNLLTALTYDAVFTKGFVECPRTWTAVVWAPSYLTWDVTAGGSIAGVTFEIYVLQDQTPLIDVLNKSFLFIPVGYDPTTPLDPFTFTQTDSVTCYDRLATQGMGYRLLIGGSFGAVDVTSYTYFNLYEDDLDYYLANVLGTPSTCPIIGKSGNFAVGDGCNFPFVEEYVTIEGFTFGCATIDMALKILCSGFDSLKLVVKDIALGNWGEFDFAIRFTTTDKDVTTCIELTPLAGPCFTVELAGVSATKIDSVEIVGFKFASTFAGVKFTSITELGVASTLMSTISAWTYLNGPDQVGFLVPFAGMKVCGTTPVYWTIAEGVYQLNCIAEQRYRLWEKFVIDVDADACCGGLFDLVLTTYFGNQQVLSYYGYYTVLAGTTAYGTGTSLLGTLVAPTTALTSKTYDRVFVVSGYADGTQKSLFEWARTTVALGVGVGANITLNAGLDISVFGWDKLTVGFKWSF